MEFLPLDRLGCHEIENNKVEFGFLLPWVTASNGNKLYVKIIKEEDQFLQNSIPHIFPLDHSVDDKYGDFWSGTVEIKSSDKKTENSKWGEKGRYVYRYELESPLLSNPLDWIVDPLAREFGIGRQSAFTLGYEGFEWGEIESTWKTPKLENIIAYEIMINEFAPSLDEAIEKIPYLKDLGINCIEIMPVSNVYRSIDWGFEPIGFLGVDERFGKRANFQEFVQIAHEHGIAVVLDMIYGHTGSAFAYEYIYKSLKYHDNPFMGTFAKDMFGPSVDYHKKFTRDFYFTINYFWFDRFHIDGIRYDCVPNYYDGFIGEGYSNLVYQTYQKIIKTNGIGHWQRFFDEEGFNLIQCAEQLEAPIEVVEKTYSNCTWQNETLNTAKDVAHGNFGNLYGLGMQLGLNGYPETITHNNDTINKTAFQYLENHDHPRFICNFGTRSLYDGQNDTLRNALREGVRENWYKVQPFSIGLLLAKGIPMLWQGQEILENYDVPDTGPARIGTLRPVRWEFFYTYEGQQTIDLYRNLIALRKKEAVFRKGKYYFYNNWVDYQSKGVLVFSRQFENTFALVVLNFSSSTQNINFKFEEGGTYNEQLHYEDNLLGIHNDQVCLLTIPSNYGKVWLKS